MMGTDFNSRGASPSQLTHGSTQYRLQSADTTRGALNSLTSLSVFQSIVLLTKPSTSGCSESLKPLNMHCDIRVPGPCFPKDNSKPRTLLEFHATSPNVTGRRPTSGSLGARNTIKSVPGTPLLSLS